MVVYFCRCRFLHILLITYMYNSWPKLVNYCKPCKPCFLTFLYIFSPHFVIIRLRHPHRPINTSRLMMYMWIWILRIPECALKHTCKTNKEMNLTNGLTSHVISNNQWRTQPKENDCLIQTCVRKNAQITMHSPNEGFACMHEELRASVSAWRRNSALYVPSTCS